MAVSAILRTVPAHENPERDSVAVDAYVFDTLMRDLIGHDRAGPWVRRK